MRNPKEALVEKGKITMVMERITEFNYVNPHDPNKRPEHKTLGQAIDEVVEDVRRDGGMLKTIKIDLPEEMP